MQLSSDIVKVSSTGEALYCLVRLSSCLCFLFVSQAFLEEVWNKTQIENVSIFIIYLLCKQLYLKLVVSTLYVTFQENKLVGISLKTLYICHI